MSKTPQFLGSWRTFITFGTLLTGLGLFLLVFSSLSWSAMRSVISFTVLLSGILYILLGLRISDWEGRANAYICGILYSGVGFYIAQATTYSPKELAMILGPLILVEGVLLSIVSLIVKMSPTWRWLFLSGFASIVLAFLLVSGVCTSYNCISLLLSVNFITTGLAYNAYGFDLRYTLRDA
jgi:uncharacterized membrane protein HdeD (DUF308 family)